MKKITLRLLTILFFLPLANTHGQNSITANVSVSNIIKKTIVRDYQNSSAITYLETNNGNFFIYTDVSLAINAWQIYPTYKITDFVIDNDSVFFCGISNSTNGFFGFFSINTFFSTGIYFVESGTPNTTMGNVSSLSHLVTYSDEIGKRHMVAVGETAQNLSCIVDMCHNHALGGWEYNSGVLQQQYHETINDLALTDNFIVTLGLFDIENGNNEIMLRSYNKNDVLHPNTNREDWPYEFKDTLIVSEFIPNQLAIEHATMDYVTIAAYWRYTDTTDQNQRVLLPQGTHLGLYQISNNQNSLITHIISFLTYHPFFQGGWNIKEFSKLHPQSQSFELLHDVELGSNGIQSVVYEIPLSMLHNRAPIQCRTSTSTNYNSISRFGNNNWYIMTGYDKQDNTKLVFNASLCSNNDCLDSFNLSTTLMPMLGLAYPFPLLKTFGIEDFFAQKEAEQMKADFLNIDCTR